MNKINSFREDLQRKRQVLVKMEMGRRIEKGIASNKSKTKNITKIVLVT